MGLTYTSLQSKTLKAISSTSRYGLELGLKIRTHGTSSSRLLMLNLITYAMLANAKSQDSLVIYDSNAFMQNQVFLATIQMHNPCLLYWVSPVEYTRVLTLCDLKFCWYRSPCA